MISKKKKNISSTVAINIVTGFVAVMVVGYIVVAGLLLGKKSKELEVKLDAMELSGTVENETGYYSNSSTDPEFSTGSLETSTSSEILNQVQNDEVGGSTQKTTCYNDHCFDIEIADTSAERAKGLMFREDLGIEEAMLFVFDQEGLYPFWMKNTLINLDIIRLDKSGKIVDIAHNVPPCGPEASAENNCPNYKPNVAASYVLEIKGGLAYVLGMEVGDVVVISY